MKTKSIITVFFLLFISMLVTAQKWETYGKGLSNSPVAACVFKDKIVIVEESDSGNVLKEVNEAGVSDIIFLNFAKECTLFPTKDFLYIFGSGQSENNIVYQWDGQNLKNITPKQSIVYLGNAVYYENKLYVCGEFNDLKPEFIQLWNGSTWEAMNTNCTSSYGKKLFVFNNKLFLIANDFDNKTTISGLNDKKWKSVVSGSFDLYTPFSIVEYQGKMVIYTGQSDTWYSFDGNKMKKNSWPLQFDNYGSHELIFVVHNNSLYLMGRFWSEYSELGNALVYNGSKWKTCGDGLTEAINYAFEYKGSVIVIGEISKSGELEIKNIARMKED